MRELNGWAKKNNFHITTWLRYNGCLIFFEPASTPFELSTSEYLSYIKVVLIIILSKNISYIIKSVFLIKLIHFFIMNYIADSKFKVIIEQKNYLYDKLK